MWDINDYDEIENSKLRECYKIYLESLNNLAIFYTISKESSINYSKKEGKGKEFFLSNNFPECATTVITDYKAIELIENNTYFDYLKKDFIIRLCLIFEDFINKLLIIAELDEKEATSFNKYSDEYKLKYKSDSLVLEKYIF